MPSRADACIYLEQKFDLTNTLIYVRKFRKENSDKATLSTLTYDDRIANDIYCARSTDMVGDFVENPEKLEMPFTLTEDQLANLGLAKSEL